MTDAKTMSAVAWKVEWAAKQTAEANEAMQKMLAEQKKAESATTPDDRFAAIDWTKPLPEFSLLLEPHFDALKHFNDDIDKRPEYGAARIAQWTDDAVATGEAALAEGLAADRRVRDHNDKASQRWTLFLTAHGIERGGRVDLHNRIRTSVRAKFLRRFMHRTATEWLDAAHRASGWARSGQTLASIREDARAYVAEEKKKEQADRAKRHEADREASRLRELEQENARLKVAAVLSAPLPPKPVVKPVEPVVHGERTALLELE